VNAIQQKIAPPLTHPSIGGGYGDISSRIEDGWRW